MGKDKITAVVLAAGRGSRMESAVQKQYLMLGNYPVIYYSLKCFQDSEVDDIILVVGQDEITYCEKEIVKAYNFTKVSRIIAGGNERYESVYNAIMTLEGTEYVLIHDGARPFVTEKMISQSIEVVKEHGACTVGVPVKDTIKEVSENGFGEKTLERKKLWNVQTPQSFKVDLLRKAYLQMMSSGDADITDDTMIVERYMGHSVKVLMGGYSNLKITTPEDMKIAEIFLQ